MTNQGGSTGCSGEWTICGGSSQSYADASVSGCPTVVFFQRPYCNVMPVSTFVGLHESSSEGPVSMDAEHIRIIAFFLI